MAAYGLSLHEHLHGCWRKLFIAAALDLLGLNGGLPPPPLRPASKQIVETIRGQLDALDVLPVRV